jgi:hypothetical protein
MRLFFPVLLLVSCINFTSAQEDSKNFKITGQVLDGLRKRGKIKLHFKDQDKILEAKVRNAEFVIEGYTNDEAQVWFEYQNVRSSPFYIEQSEIDLKVSKAKLYRKSKRDIKIWRVWDIKGSATEVLNDNYRKFYSRNYKNKRFDYLLFNYLSEKVKIYPQNRLYFDIIFELSEDHDYLSKKQFLSIVEKMDLSEIGPVELRQLSENINRNDQ